MAKSKQKTNVEFLRGILEELGKEDMGTDYRIDKMNEGFEFVGAIEEEQTDYEDEIRNLKSDVNDKESEIEKLEETIEELEDEEIGEEVFLGLDTMYYRLENGNLKIQLQFEHWCEQVQKQNAVVPA